MHICEMCNKDILDEDYRSDDSGEYHWNCYDDWCKKEALSHGIPLSVVESNTKLSDHFSKGYIDWKCNKGSEK